MKDYYVISDPHGCFFLFEAAVEQWNPETHKLILLGDYVDRGYNSLGVIQKIYDLSHQYPEDVVVMMGNHDDMFLEVISDPTSDMYTTFIQNGGDKTMESFFGQDVTKMFKEQANELVSEKLDLLKFMATFKPYHEEEHVIFAHAGVRMPYSDLHFAEGHAYQDFLWLRHCHRQKNVLGKVVVFGHTPVQQLLPKKSPIQPYISTNKDYIGVDGGACFKGGALLAVDISYTGEVQDFKTYKYE